MKGSTIILLIALGIFLLVTVSCMVSSLSGSSDSASTTENTSEENRSSSEEVSGESSGADNTSGGDTSGGSTGDTSGGNTSGGNTDNTSGGADGADTSVEETNDTAATVEETVEETNDTAATVEESAEETNSTSAAEETVEETVEETQEEEADTYVEPTEEEMKENMGFSPEEICLNAGPKCCTFSVIRDDDGSLIGYGKSCSSSKEEDECTGDEDIWCPAPTTLYSDFTNCDTLYVKDIEWGGSYIGSGLTDTLAIVYDTIYSTTTEKTTGKTSTVEESTEETFLGYVVLLGVSNTSNSTMLKCVLVNYYTDGTWEQVSGSPKYISQSGATVRNWSHSKIINKYNSSTGTVPDDKYKVKSLDIRCYEGLEYKYS